MISIAAFTTIFLVFLCSPQIFSYQITVDQSPLAATCSAETISQVFASIFFIDLISVHRPEMVFGWPLPSNEAADIIYNENLRIFENYGFSNAEYIATTAESAVSLDTEFTIWTYYLNVANTVGEFLAEAGILTCDNVIQVATEYIGNEQKAFEYLVPAELKSYVYAIITGLEYLLEDHGYTNDENEVNWQILLDTFYRKYKEQTLEGF